MDRQKIAALYSMMFCASPDETARCAEIADAVTDSVEEKLRDPASADFVRVNCADARELTSGHELPCGVNCPSGI